MFEEDKKAMALMVVIERCKLQPQLSIEIIGLIEIKKNLIVYFSPCYHHFEGNFFMVSDAFNNYKEIQIILLLFLVCHLLLQTKSVPSQPARNMGV